MDLRQVIVIDDDDGDGGAGGGAAGLDLARAENRGIAAGMDTARVENVEFQRGGNELVVFQSEPRNELPLVAVPLESTRAVFPRQSKRIPGKVIDNPPWLPPEWITEVKVRQTGLSAGNKDKYFFELATGKRFRSKVEVDRYLKNGLFTGDSPELRSLPAPAPEPTPAPAPEPTPAPAPAPASSNPVSSRPKYYYQPVVCESPAYADHPGHFPVVYFPVIGDSPEDQFKPPPIDILANMQLKPIFSQPPYNVPPSLNMQLKPIFSQPPPNVPPSIIPPLPANCKQNLGNVQAKKSKKRRTVSRLAESNAVVDLNLPSSWDGNCCGNYPVKDTIPQPTSLTLSGNNSHFRVTVPPAPLSHIQYNPNYSRCHSSGVMPCQNQNNVFQARSEVRTPPVRMRGLLSEARILALKKDQKL